MKETQKQKETHSYRTGPTSPQGSYGGIIAVLLVAVILLGGLASILGIMNIRLLDRLSMKKEETTSIRFSAAETTDRSSGEVRQCREDPPSLGVSAESVTAFLQEYYDLPQGIYITAVEADSPAEKAGLIPGDIILTFEDMPITDEASLNELLCNGYHGQIITLTIYRSGNRQLLSLMLD